MFERVQLTIRLIVSPSIVIRCSTFARLPCCATALRTKNPAGAGLTRAMGPSYELQRRRRLFAERQIPVLSPLRAGPFYPLQQTFCGLGLPSHSHCIRHICNGLV